MFKEILPYLFYLAGSIFFAIGSIICILRIIGRWNKMLRARIYINIDELEDIQIVNSGTQNKKGETKYQVTTLTDSFYVYHTRADGYIKLLIKVLRKMQKGQFQPPPDIQDINDDDRLIQNILRYSKER